MIFIGDMIHFIKNLFKKKYKWVCEFCGDIVKSDEQPLCKACCHIEKMNAKMHKISNKKKCCGGKCK